MSKTEIDFDLNGRQILITGGTGSFGREFVQTVLQRFKLERLVIFSRDEFKQYMMQQELPPSEYPCLRYFIGDVRDRQRLNMALKNIDVVIHAAAMKHVPATEYNPFECIHTNVIGAENIVTCSIENGVKDVIALSTDKAASPVNLYGASKLASDKIHIAANTLSAGQTRFSVVRYGNVLGSRGSVIPFFRDLLEAKSDHLPITDPRMTRFFISLQDGVEFVLKCLHRMHGGEIFVPKIPSIKITDLAKAMGPELEQRTVGIRPGEKLHETMITSDDSRNTVEMTDYYVIKPVFLNWEKDYYTEAGGKVVPEGFRYSSDENAEWLEVSDIQALLKKLGV